MSHAPFAGLVFGCLVVTVACLATVGVRMAAESDTDRVTPLPSAAGLTRFLMTQPAPATDPNLVAASCLAAALAYRGVADATPTAVLARLGSESDGVALWTQLVNVSAQYGVPMDVVATGISVIDEASSSSDAFAAALVGLRRAVAVDDTPVLLPLASSASNRSLFWLLVSYSPSHWHFVSPTQSTIRRIDIVDLARLWCCDDGSIIASSPGGVRRLALRLLPRFT